MANPRRTNGEDNCHRSPPVPLSFEPSSLIRISGFGFRNSPTMPRPKTLLILSQVFLPDPASVGQHVADVAIEMARRGYRVRVFAANRGYENPSIRYLGREQISGVEVRRLPLSSFGKKRIATRLVGTVIFM